NEVARVEGLNGADEELRASADLALPRLQLLGVEIATGEAGVNGAGAAARADPEAEVGRGSWSEQSLRALEHRRHRGGLVDGGCEEGLAGAERLPCAHPCARDHGADARSAVAKGDQPEPAALLALAEDDDLDVALALALVAPGAPDLREERGPIEVRDALDRARRPRHDRVAPAGVDHDPGLDRLPGAAVASHLDADRAAPVEDDARRFAALVNLGAARAGAAEQELVEAVSRDLEGVVPSRLKGLAEG